jgi:catechol 2,3-dioxygenase-like lactoylglutathione lyase family enzyme
VIHLSKCSNPAPHNAHVYVLTRDTDAYAELVRQRGATFEFGRETTDYGMRELSLRDPDGNTLTFGEGTSDED